MISFAINLQKLKSWGNILLSSIAIILSIISIYFQFFYKVYDLTLVTIYPIYSSTSELDKEYIAFDLVFSNKGNQSLIVYEAELGYSFEDSQVLSVPKYPCEFGDGHRFEDQPKTDTTLHPYHVGPIFVGKGDSAKQTIYISKELIARYFPDHKQVGIVLSLRYDMDDGRIASQSIIIASSKIKQHNVLDASCAHATTPIRLLPLPSRAKPNSLKPI